MKLSIIVPLYNEPYYIQKSIQSLTQQEGLSQEVEIIIVDDGSNEETKSALLAFKDHPMVKVISHEKNLGRLQTRLTGAKMAQYKRLLFMDSRITVNPLFLKNFYREEGTWIPGKIPYDEKSWLERVLFLIRNFSFREYYSKRYGKPGVINPLNFDKTPKGTGTLLTQRKTFIQACKKLEDLDKNSSDDTKLLKEMIALEKEIHIDPQGEIIYHQRKGFGPNLKHLFNRGPKFIDYYLRRPSRFQLFILVFLSLLLLLLSLCLLYPSLIMATILFTLVGASLSSLILCQRWSDVPKVGLIFPLLILCFGTGLVWGVFLFFSKSLSYSSSRTQ